MASRSLRCRAEGGIPFLDLAANHVAGQESLRHEERVARVGARVVDLHAALVEVLDEVLAVRPFPVGLLHAPADLPTPGVGAPDRAVVDRAIQPLPDRPERRVDEAGIVELRCRPRGGREHPAEQQEAEQGEDGREPWGAHTRIPFDVSRWLVPWR